MVHVDIMYSQDGDHAPDVPFVSVGAALLPFVVVLIRDSRFSNAAV